jgi:toxin-antitoxin system PIN domain toxin
LAVMLVDVNIPLYAANRSSPHHEKARCWWDDALSGSDPVCLCWQTIGAFLRISTNRRAFAQPFSVEEATEIVQKWLDQPSVQVLVPTIDHWQIFRRLLTEAQGVGNLVSDAHLAALALEHGCWLFSADADFARFRGLKWKNPLV